jgi:uncharacterized cupin superfamily protein
MDYPIVNLDELEFREFGHGDRFSARLGSIGTKIGARQLGYNLTVLPSGKRAFPFHNHRVNEEMFFILEGEGELRLGGARHPIRAGDVIACPPGGPETAHQIVNTSDAELRYLAVSTRLSPEIAEYPDSGKFGVLAEVAADADDGARQWRFVGRSESSIDYWDGE